MANKMNLTRKEKLELLKLWNEHYNNLSKSWEKVSEVFGTTDSELFSNTFTMFDAYTDSVAKLVGDNDDVWLNWWTYDCDQGNKYPYIQIGSKKMKCKSLEDLLKIIEATTNKTK